ncbi:unnamed protein product [Adineta steineri]|uniref:Uncharacterized protein n=1 Tax=Adineta steineri TaxID=433720 RepID=A0A820BA44_9BILA|nr:unnamed protein product [Adineta steineri]CAF4204107.1 unnamed protein product [Adineta steineri]
MTVYSRLVPIGWIAHLGACFYSVRPLRSLSYRTLLTIVPCAALMFAGSQNLPHFHMSSVMTVSLYWMISIRLVDLIVFSPEKPLSLWSYAGKFLCTAIVVKSQICKKIAQYGECSTNIAYGCFHMIGTNDDDTGVCGFLWPTCSRLLRCNSSDNSCIQSNTICVKHPYCHDLPICYPVPMISE